MRSRPTGSSPGIARWLWRFGAATLMLHLLLAFGLRHHWSHASAVAEIAHQTQELFGLSWGGGIWFNYLLVAWWTWDAWRPTQPPTAPLRRAPTEGVRRGFFWLMWFNGAVVFASGTARGLALVLCLVVLIAWWPVRTPGGASPLSR